MGGEQFFDWQPAAQASVNLQESFDRAVEAAQWEHGHRGYTGTLAEKSEVVLIQAEPLDVEAASTLAEQLIEDGDERIDDKWGPAGAIPLIDGGWLFFGWASS